MSGSAAVDGVTLTATAHARVSLTQSPGVTWCHLDVSLAAARDFGAHAYTNALIHAHLRVRAASSSGQRAHARLATGALWFEDVIGCVKIASTIHMGANYVEC